MAYPRPSGDLVLCQHQRRRPQIPRTAPADDRGRGSFAGGLPLFAGSRGARSRRRRLLYEAQRILRLEKGHLIVGQDTDGLTGPYDVGLGLMVKLDKDDFTGKPELEWQSERDVRLRLVGLQPHDGSLVPPEASQIVEEQSDIVGRITSSRMSPTLGRSICLGFVATHLTTPGTKVTVQLPDGERIAASVTPHHAHYDPEGTRQRG